MTSFVFDIDDKSMAVALAIGHVRTELQNAFLAEKKTSKITQQQIATKIGVNRSVINRQLMGMENLTYRSIAELAWAMGYEPDFSLHQVELSPIHNEPSHAVTASETIVAIPPGTGTLSPPLTPVPTIQYVLVLASDTQAKPRKK